MYVTILDQLGQKEPQSTSNQLIDGNNPQFLNN